MSRSRPSPGTWLRFVAAASYLLVQACALGQQPNAWQVRDRPDDGTGVLGYHQDIGDALHGQATGATGGFQLAVNARFIEDLDSKTMIMAYGMGDRRFLVWFGLDANGDLTAELEGAGPSRTITLTQNGTGHSLYHTHEIVYDGATGLASYRFDGQEKADAWAGSGTPLPIGRVLWGEGSTPGLGIMNFHSVSLTVEGAGQVAAYDAGTAGNPAVAPDPADQGWTSTAATASQAIPVSPDDVPVPSVPVATTLVPTNLEPRQATLQGEIDQGSLAATAWFEWGTDTTYGNVTPPQQLLSDTAPHPLAHTLTGLTKGTTYHYRSVAENLKGTRFGEDVAFTPEVFTVTSLADSGPGTLRQCISDAEPGDTIVFGTFETTSTIWLTSGELRIAKDLTLVGPGPGQLSISGGSDSRVLKVAALTTVHITGLGILNGQAPRGGDGGGIYNDGNLTLVGCRVWNNLAGEGATGAAGADGTLFGGVDGARGGDGGDGGDGGGIYNNGGDLRLVDCSFGSNRAGRGGTGGRGGDAYPATDGDGGHGGSGGSGGDGGAIYNRGGTVEATGCTFRTNLEGDPGPGGDGGSRTGFGTEGSRGGWGDDGYGGAIYGDGGVLALTNCTLARNGYSGQSDAWKRGEAIFQSAGTFTMNYSTVTGNAGPDSPAVVITGTIGRFFNSIVAGNGGPDVSGPSVAVSCLIGGDPGLAPFGDYGGPTWTAPPLPGSPAIDAGDRSASELPATDQRGDPRVAGAQVDIGAVEFSDESPTVTSTADSGPGSLRDTIRAATPGQVITFAPELGGQTITLETRLVIDKTLSIAGPDVGGVVIDGSRSNWVLDIFEGTVSLKDCTIRDCVVESYQRAAIIVDGGGHLVMDRCTVANNRNTSGGAGGIVVGYNSGGHLTVTNSTIAGNQTTFGSAGGIWIRSYPGEGQVPTIRNSTITGNSSASGSGGLFVSSGTPVLITGSIVAGNSIAGDGDDPAANIGGAGILQVESSLVGGDPLLAPLGDYGGPTWTMPPLPGSPAIDAGNDADALEVPTDQRGYPRHSGAHVDIGAAEYRPLPPGATVALTRTEMGADGAFAFFAAAVPDVDLAVFTAVEPSSLPLAQWIPIGLMTQTSTSQYVYRDPDTEGAATRFYRVSSP